MAKISVSRVIFPLLLSAVIYFLPSVVAAQEFSADVITNTSGRLVQGKIVSVKGKARMEIEGAITIGRIDKGVAWVIMPAQKAYMEVPLENSSMLANHGKLPNEIERKLLGKETLDGKEVEKYKIVYEANGKQNTIFSWIMPGTDIPVKTEAEDGSWQTEYKNIKVGPQPDNMFEVPNGYQKISMTSMGDMLKNISGGQSQQDESQDSF